MAVDEWESIISRAVQLATLINKLSSPYAEVKESTTRNNQEVEPQDAEHLGWGPKTTDPGPDQSYLLEKLREIIDVDTMLKPEQ